MDLIEALPADTRLFVGNSLPVRHVDQFARPQPGPAVYANRGASGIDGNLSTALGVAAASQQPLVALLGDITFYHDLNGLLSIKELGLKVTIVLMNNNGGGIFRRLPVANFEPPFTELFVTPHGLDFEPVVRMYGLDFARADNRDAFRQLINDGTVGRKARVIEIRTDSELDQQQRLALTAAVRHRITNG
jgi:2-succinyl-5-enolpyruvyl-6-hydroxy-3-cyclohexene-1-carboxylate synthase